MDAAAALSKRSFSTHSDFPRSTIVFLFIVLFALASSPVLTNVLPPLSDYINHLSRAYIINHIDSDPDLARFYMINWQILPNLMIDLVMVVLNPFVDIYCAGQIFIITGFLLILSGMMVLHRALFGNWSPVPLIATPLLYNEVMLVGVMNYIFGIGLVLWAFAAWIALRDRFWLLRCAVSTLFALVLFVCHLYAVGIYGLLVMTFELRCLWVARKQAWLSRLAAFVAAGLPFVPIMILLTLSSTWNSIGLYEWKLEGKVDGLIFAINVYYRPLAYALAAVFGVAALWARWNRILDLHPVGWFVLVSGAVIYMAMPRSLFATSMADQRLPIALVFVLAACLRLEFHDRRVRHLFVGLLVVGLAIRLIEVQIVWNRLGRVSEAFFRSVMLVSRGARVLVVYGDRSVGEDVNDYELTHAASIATIERSALVSSNFAVKGKQLLGVRPAYREYVDTENRWPPLISYFVEAADADVPYYYARWPLHFDFVYIVYTKAGATNPAPKYLMEIFVGPSFRLYRVLPGRN